MFYLETLTACFKHSNFFKVKGKALPDRSRGLLYDSAYSRRRIRRHDDKNKQEFRTRIRVSPNTGPRAGEEVRHNDCSKHLPNPLPSPWPFKFWTQISTTSFLIATALIYTNGAGITAGAGTRLILQLLLVEWLELLSFQSPTLLKRPGLVFVVTTSLC